MRRHPLLKARFALAPVVGLAIGLAVLAGWSGLNPTPAQGASSTKGNSSDKQRADFLYISDQNSDTVQRYRADSLHQTKSDVVVGPDSDGPPIHGPRGVLFAPSGRLVLVNQNVVDCEFFPGEVLEYTPDPPTETTPNFFTSLIPATNTPDRTCGTLQGFPNAPFGPRGIVLQRDAHHPGPFTLYVADLSTDDGTSKGRVQKWQIVDDGSTAPVFQGNLNDAGVPGQFHPRGLVFGPDGNLYVSSFNVHFEDGAPAGTGLGGRILRFNFKTGKFDVFVDGGNDPNTNQPCGCDLNKPEGIVFGPDGNLYVPSRANAVGTNVNDTDKILVFEGPNGNHPGRLITNAVIDLDTKNATHGQNWAQAALFGPQGRLFVPIIGNGPDAGQVRRYDVKTKHYEEVVKPGGALKMGWFLTFRKTDPATLAYQD